MASIMQQSNINSSDHLKRVATGIMTTQQANMTRVNKLGTGGACLDQNVSSSARGATSATPTEQETYTASAALLTQIRKSP